MLVNGINSIRYYWHGLGFEAAFRDGERVIYLTGEYSFGGPYIIYVETIGL